MSWAKCLGQMLVLWALGLWGRWGRTGAASFKHFFEGSITCSDAVVHLKNR